MKVRVDKARRVCGERGTRRARRINFSARARGSLRADHVAYRILYGDIGGSVGRRDRVPLAHLEGGAPLGGSGGSPPPRFDGVGASTAAVLDDAMFIARAL